MKYLLFILCFLATSSPFAGPGLGGSDGGSTIILHKVQDYDLHNGTIDEETLQDFKEIILNVNGDIEIDINEIEDIETIQGDIIRIREIEENILIDSSFIKSIQMLNGSSLNIN